MRTLVQHVFERNLHLAIHRAGAGGSDTVQKIETAFRRDLVPERSARENESSLDATSAPQPVGTFASRNSSLGRTRKNRFATTIVNQLLSFVQS